MIQQKVPDIRFEIKNVEINMHQQRDQIRLDSTLIIPQGNQDFSSSLEKNDIKNDNDHTKNKKYIKYGQGWLHC